MRAYVCADYIIGSPGLPALNMTVPSVSTTLPLLSMVAYDWSAEAVYVAEVHVNGVPVPTSYVQHSQLFARPAGNTIEFYMAVAPTVRKQTMDNSEAWVATN